MTIAEIIARLEKGEADRGLDADIAAALRIAPPNAPAWLVDWAGPYGRYDLMGPGAVAAIHSDGTTGANWKAPRFTTSLDAALTLVPEGWFWRVGRTSLYEGWAYIHAAHPDHTQPGETEFGWHKERDTTPALALCIASLKAREAQHD